MTVMRQVWAKPPSWEVTVIVVVPGDMPVTIPSPLTAATAGLALYQRTSWFVAFTGRIVATRFSVSSTMICAEDLFRLRPVTG